MITEQKLQFIRNYINTANAQQYDQSKRYFLAMARGATMAYGADGSISVRDISTLTHEIETALKGIGN